LTVTLLYPRAIPKAGSVLELMPSKIKSRQDTGTKCQN